MTFKIRPGRLITVITTVMLSLTVSAIQSARADGGVPKSVLVRVQPGVDVRTVAANYGATIRDSVPGTGVYNLTPPNGVNELTFAQRLSADPRVVYAEQDTYIDSPEANGNPFHFAFDRSPDPKTYNVTFNGSGQGGVINSSMYTQVNLGKSLSLATGRGIIVAVLDTGATYNHPALIGHYWGGYNAIQPNLPPNDLPDGINNQGVGHGTMIAGLIARLAPQASILPIRVLNGDGKGSIFTIAKGIDYAVTHGARVITMSFGTTKSSGVLNDTLDQAELAGVVLVASAGNDNVNRPPVPATGRGTIAVAALEANNVKSFYSNYGSFVRVSAPGSGIRSTYWDGGYATWSGTSFAAPFVAAEAALMLSEQPGLTAETVVSAIRKTARSVDGQNPAYRGQLGKGVIDIESAVKASHP